MKKRYVLLGLMLSAPTCFAETSNAAQANSVEKTISKFHVGAGFSYKLLHLNAEWVNPYGIDGIAYAKAGAFLSGDRVPGAQLGFRVPVFLTGKDKNGYYVGTYAGHVEQKSVDGDDKARLGLGVDLAYVMLSPERLSTFSIGVAVAEKLTNKDDSVVAEVEPRLQFSYTLSFGL